MRRVLHLIPVLLLVCSLASLFGARQAETVPLFAARQGLMCGTCHFDPNGGGQAELQLTDSDDPLEAGLEIVARPPGKKPQIMTLLSGGEQALTALALIFAVFLTNPAPICVLDEVDAPLDDANVERFCNLVQEISRISGTRFLVITHHSYTMARVDRLYGVTMMERGVSQLVSVDLTRAERLRASA
jgi:chromosome segregation protein